MRVFIAEKPSLGRTIAEYIGMIRREDGFIRCQDNSIVTWCFGHLLEMAQPERYKKEWGNRFDKQILPIVPESICLEPKNDSGVERQLAVIKQLLQQSTRVINAGDPDREGQLLVDEVLEYLHYKGPTERIFLASLDTKSLKKAFQTMCPNEEYRSWRDAAATRRTVDWLGGINMSRAMTIFGNSLGFQGVLSLGRVQTPTLRIVVDRDRQIANFVPVDYAQLIAEIVHPKGRFLAIFIPNEETEGLDPEGRLIDFNEAAAIQNDSRNRTGTITNCERKNGKEWPKLPYSLASLQIDCAARFGFSAQKVLDLAQRLYENKLTTYPRTDCEYLPEEQFGEAPEIIRTLQTIPALREACRGADLSLKGKAWDTKKITAHHAIIPTGVHPGSLSHDEACVYECIAMRYILQFWPPQEYVTTTITLFLDNGTLWQARGKIIKKAGWTALSLAQKKSEEDNQEADDKAGEESQNLPDVKKGDAVQSMDITLKRKRTSPPQHFTEGPLINAMKIIPRFVDDKAARATLRETSGLGTEATRAGILEVLKRRGYIEKRGKKLFSTEKGQSIIDLCPNSMKDIVTTAVLEDVLSDVQQGSRTAKEAVAIYSDKLAPMIQEVFSQDVSHIPCPQFEPCPLCHKALKRIKGRKSGNYFWVCCNQDCHGLFTDDNGKPGKHIVPAEVSTTYTCPECGKALVKRMRKDQSGTFWSCSGYPQCRWTASDDNGKPGLAKKTEKPPVSGPFFCPLCGQQLRYSRSRTGTPYWACFPKDHKKHTAVAFFSCDTNGAPILPKSNSRSAS